MDDFGNDALLTLLSERHPTATLTVPGPRPTGHQDRTLEVDAPHLREVCVTLRDEPRLSYDYLMSLTAVDRPPDSIEVVAHVFSYSHRSMLAIRTNLPRNAPKVPSLSPVWPAAGWHEREQFDLVGVLFEGHPDLRRIMMPDDWEGHPLRKDYVKPDRYHGIDNTRPKNG
ncbi:MAG: NADH-quinone oxidoreductase subunit C [Deltaproteobacteria bacterium]|nr:NADH-quinone oxidoreductase subunit C [Deltaproteobacteria bacterium]